MVLRDEVLLGRHGEGGRNGPGRLLRVSYGGRPLLRHSLEVSGTDPASLGPACAGRAPGGRHAAARPARREGGCDPR